MRSAPAGHSVMRRHKIRGEEKTAMIVLSLKGTGSLVGSITEEDFKFLADQLEEETEEDTDYFVTMATMEMLARAGASEELIEVLNTAVGGSEGVELSWSRE